MNSHLQYCLCLQGTELSAIMKNSLHRVWRTIGVHHIEIRHTLGPAC